MAGGTLTSMGAALLVLGGVAVACSTTSSSDIDPTAFRSTCNVDQPACLLAGATLEMDGKKVELRQTNILTNSAYTLDAGAAPPANAPRFTSTPAPLAFAPTAPTQSFDVSWTDPTASRFTHYLSLRPRNTQIRCICCFGCFATRRVFDKLTSGTTHMTLTLNADPAATTDYDLTDYPVSSTDPALDPFDVATDSTKQTSFVVGPLISVPVHVEGSKSGGGSSSGTTSGSSSGGTCQPTCARDADCADFARRNCPPASGASWANGETGVRCDATGDHKCHCCDPLCSAPAGGGPATSCVCIGCSSCPDKCIGNACANAMGGTPCQ